MVEQETPIKMREVKIPVEVPVRPVSKREIKQLEAVLIIGTLFRPDVLQAALSKEEFLTWVDSLAVAAAALAMEKAGYTVSQIAEELGRTEATIRRHLKGETKAGKLVRETYDMLIRGELKLAVPIVSPEAEEELKKLDEQVKQLEEELGKLRAENTELRERLQRLEEAKKKAAEQLGKAIEALQEAKRALEA
ncbi:helix-turn-helix domain-containing protein [Hyperthermus butylicus]|uniref:Transcriptional regulator n=1 Tax=Hyperthermus butylicus (strain DSM 5456 / JCM 9403 / PLM1-5) TaxID=415426 RepID=A2BK44_HYPBU|nr:helix-turn-helix domain-containing protein [Hyperthermus butylicus]ABM80355.1 putative transcriptional regulator [Hyperthermus butylicus DSM 5456]